MLPDLVAESQAHEFSGLVHSKPTSLGLRGILLKPCAPHSDTQSVHLATHPTHHRCWAQLYPAILMHHAHLVPPATTALQGILHRTTNPTQILVNNTAPLPSSLMFMPLQSWPTWVPLIPQTATTAHKRECLCKQVH